MRAARGAEGQEGSRVLLRREGGIKRGPREKSEAESRGKTSPRSKKTRSGGQSEPLGPACCPPYQDWPERFASPLFPPPLTAPHSQITVCGSVLRSRRAAAPGIVGCAAVRQKTRDIGPPRSPLPQHPLPTQLRETKLCEIPGEKKKKSG